MCYCNVHRYRNSGQPTRWRIQSSNPLFVSRSRIHVVRYYNLQGLKGSSLVGHNAQVSIINFYNFWGRCPKTPILDRVYSAPFTFPTNHHFSLKSLAPHLSTDVRKYMYVKYAYFLQNKMHKIRKKYFYTTRITMTFTFAKVFNCKKCCVDFKTCCKTVWNKIILK